MTLALSAIRIEGRHRKDLGDLALLARSMADVGLLHPVVVTTDGRLIAGARRVEAARLLGWDEIPATVARDLAEAVTLLRAEHQENTCRLDFAPREALALAERLKPFEQAAARERKATSNEERANFAPSEKAEARQKVAAAVGVSHETLKKAAEVAALAEADPETFEPIAAEMDRTRKVDPAHKKAKAKAREKAVAVQTEAARASLAEQPADDRIRLGDFREVAGEIADGAASLIFTDPPYDRDSLPLYEDLGRIAARILCEGGSLITYLGSLQLLEAGRRLEAAGLKFLWPLASAEPASKQRMREFGIVCKWKPLLWFVKGSNRLDPLTFVEDMLATPAEKDGHPWQQSEATAAYYIERLTKPGDLVFDGFCGAGTTPVAAKRLGRLWLACDTDPQAVRSARERAR